MTATERAVVIAVDLPVSCRDCGRATRARIEDCADLAAYIMLGALCPACAERQAVARSMGEGEP